MRAMRITLLAVSMAFLWMCGSDDPPPMPPAEHGGIVVAMGSQPLEVVAHADGQIAAYPIGTSTARGPTTSVIVHVPGVDGVVHDAPLVWDEPTAKFVGTIPVAPQIGPFQVDAVIEGAPVHAAAPVFVVLAPAAPTIVVGTAPATVGVVAPQPHARVEVVAPSRPGVTIVEPAPPPRPGVVVVAPRPPEPVVLLPPPGPPGVVIVGPTPPRPGVVIVGGDRDGRVDEGRGHWDHGRHGGGGPEWHGGGGGHGHGRGH